jgi:hypothetical protein
MGKLILKKISILVSLLIVTITLACSPVPKVDPQLEKQVQTETQEFEALLNRLVVYVNSIKSPEDIPIRTVFPDSWLFEENAQLYALGIPVSRDISRGLVQARETDQWTYFMIITPNDMFFYGWWPPTTIVYFNRGGKVNPDTDNYIAQRWTGQPFNWGTIQGGAGDKGDYPVEINPGFFKSYKVIKQPYMIPPEASFAVYQEPRNFVLSRVGISSITGIVRLMWEANPYLDKSEIERSKTPPIQQLTAQLPAEIGKINNDINVYLNTVSNFETKYFTPNSSSYNKQNELADYKNSMATIRSQLSGIDNYLQQITKWDFSRLYKYRLPQVK